MPIFRVYLRHPATTAPAWDYAETVVTACAAEAIAHADTRDVVLIAGKGHEDYQETKGVRHPFSDMAEAQKALAAREGKKRS